MSGCVGGDIDFNLKVDTTKTEVDILKLQMLINRTMSTTSRLLERLNAPENIRSAIMNVQRLITLLNTLRLTILAVEAASGPIGWALAGVGIVATALTAEDFIWDIRGH